MLLNIAWRNLWRSPYRSLLIIFSVVLGLWSGVMINAIYFGMGKGRMEVAIRKEVSHIQIHHPEFTLEDGQKYFLDIKNAEKELSGDDRIEAFSLRSIGNAMIANASSTRGVVLRGVDPEAEAATRRLKEMVVEGDYLDTTIHNELLIGQRLADRMNLYNGDKVVLTMTDTANEITAASFRVSGFYRSSNAPMDERNVYLLKSDLDDLLLTHGAFHEAAVLLSSDDSLDASYQDISRAFPNAKVETWKTISPETAYVIDVLDQFALVFMSIILLALAFGIINTMLMAVLERRRELGMLMAVGMNKLRVFAMVVYETLLLTMVGMPIGLGLAWLTVNSLKKSGIDMSALSGDSLEEFGYSSVIYPYWPADNIMQTVLLVFIAAIISSIFPSWKALRLRPVEAIRN